MFAQVIRIDPGAQILQPALPDYSNLLAPVAFGANLTIPRGMSLGRKTSDGLAYLYNKDATDGTQAFIGFNQISGATDANGLFYPVFGGTAAGLDYFATGLEYGNMYTSGVFDPFKLYTAPTGTPVAEVDTITPAGTITAADNFVIEIPGGNTVNFVAVSGSVTPTNIVTGLKASWNADPVAAALATASGTATLILTAKTAGQPMNLTSYVEGVGTAVLVITTPGVAAQQKEVDTFTATNPTTADVYTITITYLNLTTHSVSATVGATQTAAAIDALLIAAWNADPIAAAYAVASGTTTLVMTAVNAGQLLNLTGAVVGTGTIAKVVTTPTFGRDITDIQLSRPGIYVLQPYGYWRLP